MPSRRRAVDARPFGQTRRERRLAAESHRPRGDVQVQRRRTPLAGMADADPVLGGHRLERGNPVRTPGKRDKPLRYAGLWRGRQRRKSPVRRCFKSRPPFGGVRRFASGCRFCRAVNRPLVRIPAHRHTTTGTCDLGKAECMHARPQIKHYFPLTPKKRCADPQARPRGCRTRALSLAATAPCRGARTCLPAMCAAEFRR